MLRIDRYLSTQVRRSGNGHCSSSICNPHVAPRELQKRAWLWDNGLTMITVYRSYLPTTSRNPGGPTLYIYVPSNNRRHYKAAAGYHRHFSTAMLEHHESVHASNSALCLASKLQGKCLNRKPSDRQGLFAKPLPVSSFPAPGGTERTSTWDCGCHIRTFADPSTDPLARLLRL